MKLDYLKGRIGGAIVAASFLLGIGMISSATVQAQNPYRQDGQYRRDRDGDRDGRHDRDRDRDRNWRRDRDRDHDRDWNRRDNRYDRNRSYGNYGSYRNYGGYGNYGYGSNAAVSQGYQAGLNTGASDANRGQSYNPQRSHYYRDTSSQAFRQGFLRGYQEGYQRYGGRNGGYNRPGYNGGWFPLPF
jgi:hypothetical protein